MSQLGNRRRNTGEATEKRSLLSRNNDVKGRRLWKLYGQKKSLELIGSHRGVNMADISVIASAMSSIKVAADIAKLIRESSVTLEQAEIKLKLAELMSALADAKMEIANVQDELLGKDRRISELEEALNVQGRLIWESPYYWLDNDGTKDGPYCQQCMDNSRKLIRLQSLERGFWICATCKNNYDNKSYSGHGRAVSDYDPYG